MVIWMKQGRIVWLSRLLTLLVFLPLIIQRLQIQSSLVVAETLALVEQRGFPSTWGFVVAAVVVVIVTLWLPTYFGRLRKRHVVQM
jgi:hypothetical protein